MTKKWLAPTDSLFLFTETPETMMHVAGLLQFRPPVDAGSDFLRDFMADLRDATVQSPWNLKVSSPRFLRNPVQSWVVDDAFDIDYHVRRSALASPGDERELGILVSRLHSNPIDFSRPPWEMHVIEGLEDGRFAVYVKIHHALVDGVSGVKLLQRSLSTSPDELDKPPFFALRRPGRVPTEGGTTSPIAQLRQAAVGMGGAAASTAILAKAVYNLHGSRRSEHASLVRTLTAPRSVLNQRTGRNRRFATQQLEMSRIQRIAEVGGGTVNDVILAVFGGGLRAYLEEQEQLPGKSLVGFIPVDIRGEGDEASGNKVGATLAPLGTDIPDPAQRLESILASTRQAKNQMSGMTQGTALVYSTYLLAPALLQTVGALTGAGVVTPTNFNLCVSNLAGPKQTLYLKGAELLGYHPVSIAAHGMALNITCLSYAGVMNVGFVGCRDAVPHLQRLAVHTGRALDELEQAVVPLTAPAS